MKNLSPNARALVLAATALGAGLPLGKGGDDDGPRERTTSDLEAIELAHGKRQRKHLKYLLDALRRTAGISRARNAAADRSSQDRGKP